MQTASKTTVDDRVPCVDVHVAMVIKKLILTTS